MPRIPSPHAFPLVLGVLAFTASCGSDGNSPSNIPPDAAFTRSCALLACTFADSSSDPDGQVMAYTWNFGDGAVAAGQNSSHLYNSAGTYVVELTVTDDKGATGTLSQPVIVTKAPTATLELSQTSFLFDEPGLGPVSLQAQLGIINAGPGPLHWTASTDSPKWLSISPSSGTAPSPSVTVSVNTGGVGTTAGEYSGWITIAAEGASNGTQRIPVTLRLGSGGEPLNLQRR
jgi:PKD repeat protein